MFLVQRDDGVNKTTLRKVPDLRRSDDVWHPSGKVVQNGDIVSLIRDEGNGWRLIRTTDADSVEGYVQSKYLSPQQDEPAPAGVGVPSKGEAILVNHGSFNPPHRGHLIMMCAARRRLEAEGYSVIAAHLGITDASHIRGKGSPVLEDHCRVLCINTLAGEIGEPWIIGDASGVQCNSGSKMAVMLAQARPGITAFNVKGADLAEKYGVRYGSPTIWIGREGSKLPEEHAKGPTFCLAVDGETGDFSSTKVRVALNDSNIEALQHMTGPATAEYLLNLPAECWRK